MSYDAVVQTEGIMSKTSGLSVEETVGRLIHVIEYRGAKVFDVIDHSGEAAAVGLALADTKLVIFGNPASGTPLMQMHPLAALDLPLKILVWSDPTRVTRVSYNTVGYLKARHGLTADASSPLRAVDLITDAV